MLQGLIKNEG